MESFAHVPLSIGARLFGVLTVADGARAGATTRCCCAARGIRARGRGRDRQRARLLTRAARRARAHCAASCPARCPSSRGSTPGWCSSPPAPPPCGGDFFGICAASGTGRGGAVGRRVGQGHRGRRDQRDGALLRRGADLRRRRPCRGDEPDQRAAARPAAGYPFVPAVMIVMRRRPDPLVQRPATPRRGLIAAAGGEHELRGTGLRWGSTRARATAPRRRHWRPATSCSRARRSHEARREAPVRRRAPRRPARRARAHARRRRARGTSCTASGGLGARVDDDMVILALRRRRDRDRHEPPDSPVSGHVGRLHALVRERAVPTSSTERISARSTTSAARTGLARPLRRRRAGGLRRPARSRAGDRRDQAYVRGPSRARRGVCAPAVATLEGLARDAARPDAALHHRQCCRRRWRCTLGRLHDPIGAPQESDRVLAREGLVTVCSSMSEQLCTVHGDVELCYETFGDPEAPAICSRWPRHADARLARGLLRRARRRPSTSSASTTATSVARSG